MYDRDYLIQAIGRLLAVPDGDVTPLDDFAGFKKKRFGDYFKVKDYIVWLVNDGSSFRVSIVNKEGHKDGQFRYLLYDGSFEVFERIHRLVEGGDGHQIQSHESSSRLLRVISVLMRANTDVIFELKEELRQNLCGTYESHFKIGNTNLVALHSEEIISVYIVGEHKQACECLYLGDFEEFELIHRIGVDK